MALIYPSQRVMRKRVFPDGAANVAPTDPYWANVVALLHFDGTNGSTTITDSKGLHTWAVTASGGSPANATLDTSQQKFGTASVRFSAVGDTIQSDTSTSDFNIGASEDFTRECFVRFNSLPSSSCRFLNNVANNLILAYNNSTHNLAWTHGGTTYSRSWTASTGVWYFLAVSRVGSSIRLFVDGTQVGSTITDNSAVTANSRCILGGTGAGGNSFAGFNGWLDEARYTKGVGRYTANFTPPSAPFPDG